MLLVSTLVYFIYLEKSIHKSVNKEIQTILYNYPGEVSKN